MKLAVVGNYLPRQCGIATFTYNFVNSLMSTKDPSPPSEIFVVAINAKGQQFDYPAIVRFRIRQNYHKDYFNAAEFINRSGSGLCIIQHEYGIYGGESGVFILSLVRHLRIPVIVILHTVLKRPSYHEKHILKRLGERCRMVVVMSNLAVEFLTTIYHIPKEKILVVHHGVPDFSQVKQKASILLELKGKKVICTFGLLGRNKGIETVLDALPEVVRKHPDVVYLILGKTHPMVVKDSGEEYRECLKCKAKANGIDEHVVFIDRFLEEEELKETLSMVDIYITPYLNEAQITSGTLAYAVGSGTCIVSTPYWHAKELLGDGRGLLFNFGDSAQLATILEMLLNDPEKMHSVRHAAFLYGKEMYWHKIGQKYMQIMEKVSAMPAPDKPDTLYDLSVLPAFSLDHIRRLTDHTGILEHSKFTVANFLEGYSLDDNARALLMVLMAYEYLRDKEALELADIYMRYVHLMQKPDGSFHNELSYNRNFVDIKNVSEDANGRTIWALGYMVHLAPTDGYLQFAKDKFSRFFPHFQNLQSNRGIANAIMGLSHYLRRYPDNENVMKVLYKFTTMIKEHFYDESDDSWQWFEPVLSYDNAIVPLALWQSYQVTRDPDTLKVAVESTEFLEKEAFSEGHISLIGNDPWYRKGGEKSRYAQQPINAMAMVMMYRKAFQVTGKEKYFKNMFLSFSWFLGNNDLYIPLYDEESKGCCDGIEKYGLNRNQGAESIISYLMAYFSIYATVKVKELNAEG